MNVDLDTKEMELQTLEGEGSKPARRRLATPTAAHLIYERMVEDDQQDAVRRATLQGMIDGNPPYSQDELDELGLGYVCNVNFMAMRANLDSRASAAHELFVEVPTLIECAPKAAAAINNPEAYAWCSIIAEEFSQMIEDWDEFHASMDLTVRESDAYGIGYMLFENEWDWRPRAFRRGNLLMDIKAKVEVSKNEILMVRDELAAGDLFELLEDEDAARRAGWKPTYIKRLLIQVFKEKSENGTTDDPYQQSVWESLQHKFRNNEPEYESRQLMKVSVVHVLVQEVSGERKVSHFIMPESSTEPMFLYEGFDKYGSMSECIWWLPYNYGDGYARSVRGVATHMAQHDNLSNRYLCRVFDAGFMSSSLLLEPRTQADLVKLSFIQHGPFTVIPPELKAVQSTFQPQIAPLISLRGVSEQVMMNNTGTYRQHSEVVDREAPKTARQVMAETSKEARYEKAAIVHRYNQLDRLYREMFRRVARRDYIQGEGKYPGKEEAAAFIKRCTERGVDASFIYNWNKLIRVSAARAIGLGSAAVKYDITDQMMRISGSFDEIGKRNALVDFVASRVGYRNASKYVTRLDRDKITSNEHSIATLESNDMAEGVPVSVGYDQMHKLHVDAHIVPIASIIQAVETGQVRDPLVALRTMQLTLPHMVEHLQYLQNDSRRVDYLKQVSQFLKMAAASQSKLEIMAKKILRQQQQQAEAQQRQVQQAGQVLADRELEAKVYEINRKYELETLKQNSLNQARKEKTDEQMAIRRADAEANIRRKAEEQAANLQINAQKAQAEIELKRAKAQG